MAEDHSYTLSFTDEAIEDLRRLDATIGKRIAKRLRWLAVNAEVYTHKALKGQWAGLYRLRIGDYRVIYSLNHEDRAIVVIVIGHRRDIYEE